MSSIIFLQFFLGIVLIGLGANLLVSYTGRLSANLNISHFISSFIFIGLATSSPEIFITILSTIKSASNIAIGNALGSNISNIAFVFALSLLFVKINKDDIKNTVNHETIIFFKYLVFYIILLIPILWDSKIDFYESMVLLMSLLLFVIWYKKSLKKRERKDVWTNKDNIYYLLFLLTLSLSVLLAGTELFLMGARGFASYIGISNYVLGLSITAIGSSLPELAASMESIRKKNVDFVIGNILGSNIFNIAIVMGLIGLIETLLNTSSLELLTRKDVIRDIIMISTTTLALVIVAKNYNSYFVKSMGIILLTSFIIYQMNLYGFSI
jgi:cation:H+ antiporter